MILRLITLVMVVLSVTGMILTAPAEAETGRPIITAQNVHLLEKLAQFERGSLIEPFWSPDGQYIFVTGSIGIWRFSANDLESPPRFFDHYFDPLTLSPDNRTAASVNAEGDIVFWDIHTGDLIKVFYDREEHSLRGFTSLAFSPDGKLLTAGISGTTNVRPDGAVSVWDVETQQEIIFIREVVSPVEVAFSMDGSRLVTGGYSGLTVHDTTTWKSLLVPYGAYIIRPGMSSDGRWLEYWEWRNGYPVVIDMLRGEELRCETENNPFEKVGYSGDIVFSPNDPNMAAMGSQNTNLLLWDVKTCKILQEIPTEAHTLAFNPQGTQLAGVNDIGLFLYDATDLHEIASTGGFRSSIGEMTFSDDSEIFAYEYKDSSYYYADAVRAWITDDYSELTFITLETNLDTLENPFLRDNVEAYEYVISDEVARTTYRYPALRLKTTSNTDLISGTCASSDTDIADFIRTVAPAGSAVQTFYDTDVYPITWACISPDQRTLITSGVRFRYPTGTPSFGLQDYVRSVQVWNVTSGDKITTLVDEVPTSTEFTAPNFIANGQYFTLNQNTLMTVWDTTQWKHAMSVELQLQRSGQFVPGFHLYLSNTVYDNVDLIDVETGEVLRTIKTYDTEDSLVSPDGTLVAFKRRNRTVELWGIPPAD